MLRECVTSHPECQPGQVLPPTRLLFLGDHLSSRKIVEPCDIDFHQYAALSHCWGISKSLELKNGNEALMKQSTPWDSLPQTYRDAVSVCRTASKKIDYLWINSLCIKQDHKQDWDREALKMVITRANQLNDLIAALTKTRLMYSKNALIVIAASCCRSAEESFLKPRTPANCGPVVVAWNGGQEPKPLLQVQKVPIMGIHIAQSIGISDSLDTRAWTFQEKRFARRFLNPKS
jgi:predicted transposase YbfD/YdcC